MKALLYTSDPYEPSGVIGLFETEQEKQVILQGFKDKVQRRRAQFVTSMFQATEAQKNHYLNQNPLYIQQEVDSLTEIEIPIGVYGEYY